MIFPPHHLQAPLRTSTHGGLQRTTKQGLRYIATSPEHFQRTLKVGASRLQRTLDWLEFHESSTVFTAFDYMRDDDDRVHEASLTEAPLPLTIIVIIIIIIIIKTLFSQG